MSKITYKNIVFLMFLISFTVSCGTLNSTHTLSLAEKEQVVNEVKADMISQNQLYSKIILDLYEIMSFDSSSHFWVHLIKGDKIEVNLYYGVKKFPKLQGYEELMKHLNIEEVKFRPENVVISYYYKQYNLVLIRTNSLSKNNKLFDEKKLVFLCKNNLGEWYVQWIE